MGGWISYIYNKSTENITAMDDGNIWTGLNNSREQLLLYHTEDTILISIEFRCRKRIEANSFNGQDSNFLYGGLIFDLKF